MTDRLEVQLLGGAAFLLNGRPVKSLPTRVAQALLIYLLHQKYPVERERLIDMFYQASAPKQAAANFRSTLSRLRKELASFLLITNRTVGIAPNANIWIDTKAFDQWVSENEWEQALTLYQGDFLAGFFLRDAPEFENWALVERERLRLLAVKGLQTKVAACQRHGDYWAGLQAVNQLLALDPYLEAMHCTKLLLLARTGQRPLALQHYRKLTELFEEELGITVAAETTALYERISNLAPTPPLKLPTSIDKFIGRKTESQMLTKLLLEPSRRLITLFGIGGLGKTRLAAEAAQQIAQQNAGMFLDGIYFISFVGVAAAESADSIALHLMQTMGLPLGGREAPADQAIAALAKREVLLIFDNVEHLVSQCSSFMARLLREAPAVKLIATSRERLNLIEETVFDLSGLPFHADDLLESEAAQLFVTHAQRHQFTFAPTVDDVPAITRMCQILEGIPLGLELAAGSVRHLDCAEIAQNIENNLGFLASPLQNIPPRHRSLRAVFLHSWELLAPELRPVFANLAIFPNFFDAQAAQAVAGASLAHLNTFADKALLKAENGRYAIHPLLREFAAEQNDSDKKTTLQNCHSRYFAIFIVERSQSFHRPTYLKGLPTLVAAYDDLVLAWRWAIEQLVTEESEAVWEWVNGMRRPLQRLHYQRSWFHASRMLYGQARQQLEAARWHEPNSAMPHRLLHAQLTVAECNSARILGDVETAVPPVKAVIPLLRQNVVLDDLFDAYNVLAGSSMEARKFEAVPELLDEMEAIAAETKNSVMFGVLYVSRSYYTDFMGDAESALSFAQKALTAFQDMEDTFYEAIVMDGIARRLFSLNRLDDAAEALRVAYTLAEGNNQTLTMAFAQKGLASYCQKKGMLAEAEQALAISRRLFTTLNEQRNLVEVDLIQGLIAYKRQQWAAMTRLLIASLQRSREQQMTYYLLNSLVYLPILHWQRGEPAQALALTIFLQAQSDLTEDQQAAVDEAVKMMGDVPVEIEREAGEIITQLSLESVIDEFLRDGLKWFK